MSFVYQDQDVFVVKPTAVYPAIRRFYFILIFLFYCRIPMNSPAKSSKYNMAKFKTRFRARGYLHNIIEKITSEIKKKNSLNGSRHYNKTRKCEILSFFTPCHPVLPNLKTRGGYSPKIPIRVCAAQRGRDFGTPYLERGIHFRDVS